MPGAWAAVVVIAAFLLSGLKVRREYERAVVFRLGLLVEREKINAHLQSIIDQHTEPWGIKVVQVAIKFIDLPEEMRRVMAHQAEAERERRAKVIAAEGEYQAAQRLVDAAAIMAKEPIALQLRFLQTLVEVAAENNSTTIFPVPIDILKALLQGAGDRTT